MPVKEVDVRRAREMQEAEGYTYVDVRSIPEYEQGHPAAPSMCRSCTSSRRQDRCGRMRSLFL